MNILPVWYRLGRRLEHNFEDGFEKLGRTVGTNPCKIITGVIIFVILCAVGFLNYRVST